MVVYVLNPRGLIASMVKGDVPFYLVVVLVLQIGKTNTVQIDLI